MSEQHPTKQPSLFSLCTRSLCKTLFGMVGVALGLIPFILIVGSAFSSMGDEKQITQETKTKVIANAEGTRSAFSASTPMILQLNINGAIGIPPVTAEKIQQILQESQEGTFANHKIKGIFLHINSPGGGVIQSDDIFRLIADYKKRHQIPVVAFVDGLCASGALWIACTADKIYTTNASLVGSVGVVTAGIFNVSKLMEKLGVETAIFAEGKNKDALNPFRPWTEEDKESLKPITEYYYKLFVDLITTSRPKITKEHLVENIGAKIFPAPEAYEIGFIDGADYTRGAALKELLLLAGIHDNHYQVIELEKKEWFSEFLNGESAIFNPKISMHPYFDPQFMGQPLALWIP